MKFPLFFLLLIFTFKDRNLVDNLTNLATSWTLHGAGVWFFQLFHHLANIVKSWWTYFIIMTFLGSWNHSVIQAQVWQFDNLTVSEPYRQTVKCLLSPGWQDCHSVPAAVRLFHLRIQGDHRRDVSRGVWGGQQHKYCFEVKLVSG